MQTQINSSVINMITHNYLLNIFFLNISCLEPSFATNSLHIIIIMFKFKTKACSIGALDKGNAEQCTVCKTLNDVCVGMPLRTQTARLCTWGSAQGG